MGVAPYLSAFGLGFLGTLLVTPGVKRLAAWAGAMDRPNARKVHKVPTPLWGGLGVFAAYVFAVATVLAIFPEARDARGAGQLLGVFIGSFMIVVIGMIDDRFNMAARVKLLGQLATAGAMFYCGVRIDYMSLPFVGFFYLTDLQSLALTTFWIAAITNAVNLLDGLDVLVAGVALGDLTAITLSLAGLGAILAASATLFTVLKWAGAAYLIWLGVTLWRAPVDDTAAAPLAPGQAMRQAWLVTALNPKGIAFFVAFVPQFIDATRPFLPQAAILVASFVSLAALNAACYAALASRLSGAVRRPGVRRAFNRGGGAMLMGAGLAVALPRG